MKTTKHYSEKTERAKTHNALVSSFHQRFNRERTQNSSGTCRFKTNAIKEPPKEGTGTK